MMASLRADGGVRLMATETANEGQGASERGRAAARAGGHRRFIGTAGSPHSYGSVLATLAVTYVASVSLHQQWGGSVVLVLQMGTVWLALRVSRARRAARLVATVGLIVAAFVALANLFWDGRGTTMASLVFSASALLYLVAPVSILREIVRRRRIDLESVLGAVAAYVLIGMFFAFLYQAIGSVDPAPFFTDGADGTSAESLFFSFTTLTTTGYGNLVPEANPGQTLAVVEMLLGQLFLITAVAKVVEGWRPSRRPDDRTESAVPSLDADTTDNDPYRKETR
jgi:hypothetical protein